MSSLKYGFLFSTTNFIEGYRIVQHCGIVFSDAVFTPNFRAMTSTRDRSMLHAMMYSSVNMKGTEELIDTARSHAQSSMRERAKQLGANAVINVTSDNSFGNDVMHISLYGTAVRIVSESEYEKEIKDKQDALERSQMERQKREMELQKKFDMLHAEKDGYLIEEQFMRDIAEIDSVMKIWEMWCSAGLDVIYPDVTSKIKELKDSERFYGKKSGEATKLKSFISSSIFGE